VYEKDVGKEPNGRGDESRGRFTANQSNLIAVVYGSKIDLYVNNQYLNSVSLDMYGSGYIGVFVTDKGNPTEALFRNAKVWTL
jgi:hypothetical protein